MCPRIRAVLCDEDRHIAKDFNALFPRIVMQTIPLKMEDVLLETVEFDFIGLLCGKLPECIGGTVFDRIGPVRPRRTCIRLLARMKESVVVEPVRLFLTEFLVVLVLRTRLAERTECLLERILLELLDTLEVDERRVRLIWQKEILLRQPTARGKLLEVDHHNVARKCGDGLIG